MGLDTDIRIKTGFFRHFKRKKLQRLAGAEGVLAILELWAWAADNRPNGDLTGMDAEKIADVTTWPDDPDRLVAAFVAAGLVDGEPDHYSVHDFETEQAWIQKRAALKEAGRRGAELTNSKKSPEERKAASDRANEAKRLKREQERAALQDQIAAAVKSALTEPRPPAVVDTPNTPEPTAATAGSTAAYCGTLPRPPAVPDRAPSPSPSPSPRPDPDQDIAPARTTAREGRSAGWKPRAIGEILGGKFGDQGAGQEARDARAVAFETWNTILKGFTIPDCEHASRYFVPDHVDGNTLIVKVKSQPDAYAVAVWEQIQADVFKGRAPGVSRIRLSTGITP